MSGNILDLPFRRTHSVSLADAIKQYISTKYDQHPDMFAHDLETIDHLRAEAINVREPHVSGIRKITRYTAQVAWISGKFPIDVPGKIGADFTWYPALGYHTQTPVSENNLRFEMSNILFNLAALYSQLAMALNRSTTEGLKSACNYFCLAAGVISYLKSQVIDDMRSNPSDDMDKMTLESVEQLLLAQAQEGFWQKAVLDGLKDASIAKLAAKVSDYYSAAGDWGVKSDAISTEWLHHMTAKHHHFAAAAQYRASRDCLEKRKYGEEVARLRDSLTCVNEALKESRWINKSVLEDLQGLKKRVQEDLKRAEKDNDIIYLVPVPPKSELKTLDRANMATVKVPKEISEPTTLLGERGELGQPLFVKLVPFAVHVAASIYEERRDRLVRHSIIDELESLTAALHSLLLSLNLPGSLQALEKPLGPPPSLVSHAEEIRQQDGLSRIYRTIEDVDKLKRNDRAIYTDGVSILESEAFEDEQARAKYGTDRWRRLPSREEAPGLYDHVGGIDGYFKSATASDDLVRQKLSEHEGTMRVLAGSDADLRAFVPSGGRTAMGSDIQRAAGRLRGVLNEINSIESRRRRKMEALKEKAKADDINPVILTEAARLEREYPLQKIEPAHFEDLFARRLQQYGSDEAMLKDEGEQQERVATRLREATKTFDSARRGDTSNKAREQALQKLETAYFKYREIVSNLDVGRKFYNDLAKIVIVFRDECKAFTQQRRNEAEHMLRQVYLASPKHLGPLAQTDSLRRQRQDDRQYPPYAARAPASQPLAAPTPTRLGPVMPPAAPGMWTPEMGIKFGGAPPPSQPPAPGQAWDASRQLKFG
ncbi:MAG: pH-response regulator protein palA/rim20 [Thelocarpon superellum]|nr:MAG: pH-response regulator protein palA/rim20 [Thelocarpon superellum]